MRERNGADLGLCCCSIGDETAPSQLRGKYGAFTAAEGAGMQHLNSLHEAGLTHIHLLPAYDYGSVPERPEDQAVVKVSTRAHLFFCSRHVMTAQQGKQCWDPMLVQLCWPSSHSMPGVCVGRLISNTAQSVTPAWLTAQIYFPLVTANRGKPEPWLGHSPSLLPCCGRQPGVVRCSLRQVPAGL